MSQTAVEFLEKFRQFVVSEANTQHRQLERQWSTPLSERVARGWAIEGVRIEEFHNNLLHLSCATNESRFDAYSLDALAASSSLDLNQLRYADLPACGLFEANALTEPDTAEVLATFANGLPAVTLNKYGQGEVVVLNWQANERTVAVGAEILQRSLRRLRGDDGQVYLLRSKTNAEEYGDASVTNVATWRRTWVGILSKWPKRMYLI